MGLTQKLGTIPLAIFTDASNNIGIGGSPSGSFKLDVTGTGRFTSNLFTGAQIAMGGESVIYGGLSGLYALQNGNSSFYSYGFETGLVGNAYFDSGWKYKTTGAAIRYLGSSGSHNFQYAGSGTGGAALTWLNAMVITASGNVGIGTNSPVAGILQVNAASNSQIALVNTSVGTSWLGISSTDMVMAVETGGNLLFKTGCTYPTGVSTGTERMRISSTGNVGIGNNNSNVKLFVRSTTQSSSEYAIYADNSVGDLFSLRNDGLFQTGNRANSPYNANISGRSAVIDSSGTLGYLVSTRESKANIESIKSVDFIKQLNPVQFNYRKKDIDTYEFTDELYDNITYGFIADEVEKVNKDLVFYNSDGTTLAGVEYNSMIAILTKAIQELSAKVSALENKS